MIGTINFKYYMIYFCSIEKETLYNSPEEKDFEKLKPKYSFERNGIYYRIDTSKINSDIWIHIEYGNPMPRPKTIVNIRDDTEKDNQRSEDEVELSNQIFFLYSFKYNTLYVSDSRRVGMLKDFFRDELEIDINFKSYYDLDKFISVLKSVDTISFTCEKNLFSKENKLLTAYEDLTGASSPTKFEIKTKYSTKKEVNDIIPFINKLFNEKANSNLNRLIIKGISDDNFNIVYNTDAVTESLSINIEKNEEGKYNSISVRNELLKNIYLNDI
ncbi:hypothetical protein [uncultured Brachyspira sp.]|jgi:hypothetical protein|uniref:hypothetical protein n=1 Tax=uncultured Brachyspira sp. TaxID=221953 RepID=UPI00320B0000